MERLKIQSILLFTVTENCFWTMRKKKVMERKNQINKNQMVYFQEEENERVKSEIFFPLNKFEKFIFVGIWAEFLPFYFKKVFFK